MTTGAGGGAAAGCGRKKIAIAAVTPKAAARTSIAIKIHGGGLLARRDSIGAGSATAAGLAGLGGGNESDDAAPSPATADAAAGGLANGSLAIERRSSDASLGACASSSRSAVAKRELIGTTLLRALACAS